MIEADKEILENNLNDAMKSILYSFADLVRKKREEKGLSHRELYKESKVSTAVISDLETHKSLPKLELLFKICITLDINLAEFFKAICNGYAVLHNNTKDKPQHNVEATDVSNTLLEHDMEIDKGIIATTLLNNKFSQDEISHVLQCINYIQKAKHPEKS